ncbi:hypothetical protein [Niabella beijingensis]|uniref:hypothetical protein n=1 Tax=Niabella beijingensis TaxID=2872700 RepID=UPI001CBB813E|nr:hypothetical protein [Niabella beijingensis]MBZ4187677.1 hypothetical protein [Niabella beijingensis]
MKKELFFLLAFILLSASCSTKVAKSIDDLPLIVKNQKKYVHHPLSKLLKDIKPEIKLFMTNESADQPVGGRISFFFVDYKHFVELGRAKVKQAVLRVDVLGKIAINDEKLPKEERFLWTREYFEKNKNLIVTRVAVSDF